MPLSSSQLNWLNQAAPLASREGSRIGVSPDIILAQAALETGYGQHAPNNNYFGIKGSGQNFGTTECGATGCYSTNASFRGYGSMSDSFAGYGDFITSNPRYSDFIAANDVNSELRLLQQSGYATDPNYSSKLGNIINTIKNNGIKLASKAKKILTSDEFKIATDVIGGPTSVLSNSVSGILGDDTCGTFDIVCKLKRWESKTRFFERASIVILALILIVAALYLLGTGQTKNVVSKALING